MGALKPEIDKSRIALSIDQMRNLISLGLNCEDASMVYHPVSRHSDSFLLQVSDIQHKKEFWNDEKRIAIVGEDYFNQMYGRDVPAYTADVILRKIPQKITLHGIKHQIYFTFAIFEDKPEFQASYNFRDEDGTMKSAITGIWVSDTFLTLLFKVLVWCITNNHLEL